MSYQYKYVKKYHEKHPEAHKKHLERCRQNYYLTKDKRLLQNKINRRIKKIYEYIQEHPNEMVNIYDIFKKVFVYKNEYKYDGITHDDTYLLNYI